MGFDIVGLGIIFIVILFVLSVYNNDQKDAEKCRLEIERIRYLRDKIPIYENILRGFVIRFPCKSPYNILIHSNSCIQSKPTGESSMSSSWRACNIVIDPSFHRTCREEQTASGFLTLFSEA